MWCCVSWERFGRRVDAAPIRGCGLLVTEAAVMRGEARLEVRIGAMKSSGQRTLQVRDVGELFSPSPITKDFAFREQDSSTCC